MDPPLRTLMQEYGLTPRKSLGQHFLLDGNLTDKITRQAGDLTGRTVIEIGPGPGGLTRSLLQSSAQTVIAVEKDERALALLERLAEAHPGRLQLQPGDALHIAAHELGAAPRCIAANLPYNISTALLIGWLRHIDAFEKLVLMFQKEVAERLLATPASKEYGRLSVLAQYSCHIARGFDIPASAFVPPPKVVSTVVILTPRPSSLRSLELPILERITEAAFGQRRKMLRSSLKTLLPDPLPLLDHAGIDPTRRAESLTVDEFIRLGQCFERLRA